eukprot:TRINITY_DN27351_c0_g2_i1.p1 TRINITY_DN27351_c0_g2~~TRINITY_DN27351_c0_g2_i1.p1  ORF type:complete len:344 (-),score=26.92 TRINITY_DN27351_c0_g2_i1:368-1399(-)
MHSPTLGFGVVAIGVCCACLPRSAFIAVRELTRVVMAGLDFDKVFAGPAVELGEGRNAVKKPPFSQFFCHNRGNSDAQPQPEFPQPLRVVTWNLLAPCYKRAQGGHESGDEPAWRERLIQQFRILEELEPDILLLQEWWHDSDAYAQAWFQWAELHGMSVYVSPRTSGKADACTSLVAGRLGVSKVEFKTLSYDDWGDRVLQLLLFEAQGQKWLVSNTHLTYAHTNSHDPPMRFNQGRKIGNALKNLAADRAIVLGGDFNGEQEDPAVRAVTSATGLTLHGIADTTHLDHRNRALSCDFVLTKGFRAAEKKLGGPPGCLDSRNKFCSDHRPLLVALVPDGVVG